MVAARIPARIRPAASAGKIPDCPSLWAMLMKMVSEAAVALSSIPLSAPMRLPRSTSSGMAAAPMMPMNTAATSEMTTQPVAIRREVFSCFSFRIAMNRSST